MARYVIKIRDAKGKFMALRDEQDHLIIYRHRLLAALEIHRRQLHNAKITALRHG